jgi:uncharacterized metal-binding protein
MTDIQSMMLSVCFGAVIGAMIGNLIVIIKSAIDERKAKKRRKAESANTQTSDN